jgi:hypothetical protein
MLKLHLYNLDELESEFLKNIQQNKEIEQTYKNNLTVVEILSTFEILVYHNFHEEKTIDETKKLLKELNIFDQSYNHIFDNLRFNKSISTVCFESKDDVSYNFVFNKNGLKYFYIKLIGDRKGIILEKFLNLFKFDVFIKSKIGEDIERLGNERNLFYFKEIEHYLEYFKISYGLIFYLIKNYLSLSLKYVEINEINSIKNTNISIQNSARELMDSKLKKRWRSNKKMHMLNIVNITVIEDEPIFQNKNKYYIKYEEEIYNIKNIFSLKRENIIKIKEKYNRSNETLYIYKNDLNRYIMKTTKSVSKSLEMNLKEITYQDYIRKIKLNE